MKKFRNWLKKQLYKLLDLDKVVNAMNHLEKNNTALIERHRRLESIVDLVDKDNRIILNHVKLINKDFSVLADISPAGYDPSVVIVLKKYGTQKEVIKTYHFKQETVEQIFRFLEGFGEENVKIDFGPGKRPRPNFRY